LLTPLPAGHLADVGPALPYTPALITLTFVAG
jgi:hypothetical protein